MKLGSNGKNSSLLKAFYYAFNGLFYTIKNERNMRIHLFAAIMVIIAGFYFHITVLEWYIIIMLIGSVLVFEILNTTIETLVNLIVKEHNVKAKIIKDTAAAAVLIFAIISALIGFMIFFKYIIQSLNF